MGKEVYDFFNLILSPIRPPSPIDMANYFLKKYNRLRSFKGVYGELVEKRPVVLGRLIAYLRTTEKLFEDEKFSGKISKT